MEREEKMNLSKEIRRGVHTANGPHDAAVHLSSPSNQLHPADAHGFLQRSFLLGVTSALLISAALAATLSHFMHDEILDQDAALTSHFLARAVRTQNNQSEISADLHSDQVQHGRALSNRNEADSALITSVSVPSYESLRLLPEVLMVNILAPDYKVLWSTNPSLAGKYEKASKNVDDAFASRSKEAQSYVVTLPETHNASYLHPSQNGYVEHLVPIVDSRGEVIAMAKVLKESTSLLSRIRHGYIGIWTSVASAATLLCLVMFVAIQLTEGLLKAQRQRLLEADSLCVVGEMSAAVAHGIRNPLASIRSCAELSLEGDIDSARKNASNIIDQVDKLGRWVRELLSLSHAPAEIDENIDLVSLTKETLQCFKTQLEQNRVSCKFILPKQGLQLVKGNFALASQTLAVIISNAIEAMPGGGKLSLGFEALDSAQGVRLLVEDTGSGMLPAELNQIFKPYFTTKRNGLGLGMALAKRIMERFGGGIDVHSQKGVGTRVGLMFTAA
jgi:two-component system sensor histidine kinase HydH